MAIEGTAGRRFIADVLIGAGGLAVVGPRAFGDGMYDAPLRPGGAP